MNYILEMLAEKCFRRGTNTKPFLKLFASAVGYPRTLGSKALNVVLLRRIGDSYVYPTDVSFFGSAGEI